MNCRCAMPNAHAPRRPARRSPDERREPAGGRAAVLNRLAAGLSPKALLAGLRGLVPLRADGQDAIPVREWIPVDRGQPARLLSFDRTLVWVVVAMLALGLVMVYSASVALPDNPKFARYVQTIS